MTFTVARKDYVSLLEVCAFLHHIVIKCVLIIVSHSTFKMVLGKLNKPLEWINPWNPLAIMVIPFLLHQTLWLCAALFLTGEFLNFWGSLRKPLQQSVTHRSLKHILVWSVFVFINETLWFADSWPQRTRSSGGAAIIKAALFPPVCFQCLCNKTSLNMWKSQSVLLFFIAFVKVTCKIKVANTWINIYCTGLVRGT